MIPPNHGFQPQAMRPGAPLLPKPEPTSVHYPFYVHLDHGNPVLRRDRLNGVREWLHPGHPKIAGNPRGIQAFGYLDLTLPEEIAQEHAHVELVRDMTGTHGRALAAGTRGVIVHLYSKCGEGAPPLEVELSLPGGGTATETVKVTDIFPVDGFEWPSPAAARAPEAAGPPAPVKEEPAPPARAPLFETSHEAQFKRAFAAQFLASWCAANFNDYCSMGMQESLSCPPVEDAGFLAREAWEHGKRVLGWAPQEAPDTGPQEAGDFADDGE